MLTATRATDASLEEASVYTHGTTLGLNAILERKGSVTGIITNAGFRDIFEIARGDLPRGSMYDFRYRRPELLVKRRHTVGVPGRIDHRGKVVEELDHDAVIEAGRLLSERGVESVAVCFLHSYANSEHEKAAKSILTKAFPDLSVSVSVDLVREYREYERTSTAVTDAYIRPILGRYLTDLEGPPSRRRFRRVLPDHAFRRWSDDLGDRPGVAPPDRLLRPGRRHRRDDQPGRGHRTLIPHLLRCGRNQPRRLRDRGRRPHRGLRSRDREPADPHSGVRHPHHRGRGRVHRLDGQGPAPGRSPQRRRGFPDRSATGGATPNRP